MKFAFIHAQGRRFGVALLCKHLGVSQCGYYQWLKYPLGARGRRDQELRPVIRRIFFDSKRIYGSSRVRAQLRREGYLVSRKRVARLMREMGLRLIIKRKYKATTNSRHNKLVAKNKLNRRFRPARPNQAWEGDITFIPTDEGWLYLVVVLDLYSRRVICRSMSAWIGSDLVRQALSSAIEQREVTAGLLFHSDQGVQYASEAFQADLADYGMTCLMSRKGTCYDNAVV